MMPKSGKEFLFFICLLRQSIFYILTKSEPVATIWTELMLKVKQSIFIFLNEF